MSKGFGRAERLRAIEERYLYGAYTDEEMAQLVGVKSRATIFKDRQLLIDNNVPFEEVEYGRWKIDRQKYISNLRVTLHEAAALYLMARRTARQSHSPNPHVVTVLKKIALQLRQPLMDRLLQATDFIPRGEASAEETAVLEKLVACWIERRKVSIRYQGLKSRQSTLHLVSPYLLEPSLLGDGLYLVGYSETMARIVPFKVNRITKAADTSQPILPAESFDEKEFLHNVWSIWDGDGELVTVKLRFKGATAVRRIQETIWHPNQAPLEMLANGDCIWSTRIAEWREMLPWIRGWGADCEVLEPPALLREIKRDVLRLADTYHAQLQPVTAKKGDDDYDDQWAAFLLGGK